MSMKASDLKDIKEAIKAELKRRDGYGDVSSYASTQYDITDYPKAGEKIKSEHGQKTIDLLLKITDYKDLSSVQAGKPIPSAFNRELIDFCNELSKEKFTGESEKTVQDLFPDREPEHSSCKSQCTGLCVGSCINQCNGCTGCHSTCGSGCATSCTGACTGDCVSTCSTTCANTCKGTCANGCSTGCVTNCTGGLMS